MSRRTVVRAAMSATAAEKAAMSAAPATKGRGPPPLSPCAGPKAALPSVVPARVVAAV
jgi:hypothetical protein